MQKSLNVLQNIRQEIHFRKAFRLCLKVYRHVISAKQVMPKHDSVLEVSSGSRNNIAKTTRPDGLCLCESADTAVCISECL